MNAHTTSVSLTVNGRTLSADVEPRTHLADFVREALHLTGTHLGCEHGVCGACTLLLDGEPARGCLTFAASCGNAAITTIEGLDDDALMIELRDAFKREHALQCGFCTPGMLVAAYDLALRLPTPEEARIRVGLAGNLCRCTGYVGIVRAIQSVIAARRARGILPNRSAERQLGPVGAHLCDTAPREPSRPAAMAERSTAGSTATVVRDFTPAYRFEQRFGVAFPPARVFALFEKVAEVAACLPGAFVDAVPSPDRVEGGIKVKVGPIAAIFRGAATIERDEAKAEGRILGAGADGRSGAQGEIRYRVVAGSDAETSQVLLDVGYTLKGPFAQLGRPGIVREIAGRLTAEFARNIEARLAGGADATPPAADDLNPLRIVMSLVMSWFRRAPRV